MNAVPLVRVNAFLPFLKYVEKIGTPTQRLLEQARVPIGVLDDPQALIPFLSGLAFVEMAARLEGINNFGQLVAQQSQVSQLGTFGVLICRSATLYDLLQTIVKLHHTEVSGEKVWLREEKDYVWFHSQYLVAPYVKTQHAQCFSVLLYLQAFRLALGQTWQPEELHLQQGNDKSAAALEMLSNSHIVFDQPANAIKLSKAHLSLPLHHSLPTYPSLSLQSEAALYSTAPASTFIGSLQQLLLSLIKDGYPDITLTAEASGMSVRSLQRRLKESHLSYSDLVEQIRFDEGMRLLQDPSIKLTDIAFELGYENPANFTRAFKRWAGVSPREFRDLHIAK